ncbi:MAG: elongator complex protein 4 [Rhodobacteraceae bacterium]|nr:elongator complex protein 4 [Paracoccaceae bacterium]
MLLVIAALSPGVVSITLQEFAFSLAFMVMGVFGAISLAAATIAVFPQIGPASLSLETTKRPYPSLLISSALNNLKGITPNPIGIRIALQSLLSPDDKSPGFITEDAQIGMVLSQIIARWDATDVAQLNDDQIRELWLVEQLMRASPAEAGSLSWYFVSPDAMLVMRDALAAPITV